LDYLKETQRIHRDGGVLNQTSSPLLTGAIITALLAGALAGLLGAIPVLFGLFLLVFMAFSFNNYRIGIWIAVFLLPLIATKYIPREFFGIKGLNPLNANLIMAIASLAFVQAFQYKKLIIPAWPRHFWLYIGTMVIAGFYGATHFSSIPSHYLVFFDTPAGYLRDYLLKPMIIVITAFLLSVSIANARRPSNYLIPLFCSAIILPIVVIVYIALSGVPLSTLASSQSRGFLSVIGMHANEQGFMFNMVFAMALFCFFSISGTWKKWIYGGMVAILIIAIMLTFSRGAYLGFLSIVAYFLFTQRRLRMTLAVLSLAIVAAILMPSAVVERATMGISGQQQSEDVSAGRVDRIWKPLLPEVLSSPVIGHGLNSIIWSKAAQRDEILRVEHPHSAYLGVMLDFGLLGTMVIFIFFRHMWQLFKQLSISHPEPIWRGFFSGARAGVLLLLVQGLTDDRFTPTLPQAFLWFAYGMAIGLGARLNNEMPGKTEST
jgi:O-antigen ligase